MTTSRSRTISDWEQLLHLVHGLGFAHKGATIHVQQLYLMSVVYAIERVGGPYPLKIRFIPHDPPAPWLSVFEIEGPAGKTRLDMRRVRVKDLAHNVEIQDAAV